MGRPALRAPGGGADMIAQFITDLADEAVLLPMALLVAAGLLLTGWRRAALSWVVAVPVVLGLVVLGKLLALGCPQTLPRGWDLRGPSGHSALAALVYGGMVALLVEPTWRRWLGLLVGLVVAAAVGASQVQLGLRTPADVLVGGTIGLAGVWELAGLIGPRPWRLKPPVTLAVLALCLAALLYGAHLDMEARVAGLADWLWPLLACRGA